MKKIALLTMALVVSYLSNAQLTVYSNYNQQGTSGTCVARTIYTDASIPNGLNNGIKSISLTQGYMATVAENADGSGERFSYMANVSNLNVNLALQLQNKISFIRVLPLPSTAVKKKGAGATNNAERDALNVSWFYDWGFNDVSTATQNYDPMLWGAYSSIETSISTVVNKTNVSHFLAFNEPDNAGQSGSSGGGMASDATLGVPFYKKMLRAGMRMGSPACTESQYRVWLSTFTTEAEAQNLKIDYVCVHWYDWGNWLSTNNANPNPTDVFNRFKNYITAVYNLYQKPIWITEFNANVNRGSAVHEGFMALALPWLDANPNVERYAYFFGNDLPARNADGSLTAGGQVYSNHASVTAYSENIYDTRPAFEDIAAWNTASQTLGGRTVANFAPTTIHTNLTAPSGLTRGSGAAIPTTSASNGYWGALDWSTTDAAAGIAANKFLTFSLKAANGKAVSYASIDKFKVRISSNGPLSYQIDYQIGSGAFQPCSTITIASRPTASTDYVRGPIDLSGIAALQEVPSNQTVTFRITPYGASAASSSFLFGAGTADTEADLSLTGVFSESTVPVTLSSFYAKHIKDKVILNWETQSEVNFSHFILEHSTNSKTFSELAKVNASKRLTGSTYAHTDAPEADEIHYYRLKMVDLDGSFEYSKVVSENLDAVKTPFTVYPSLSSSNTIETTFKKLSKAAQLNIVNINGQLVSSYNLEAGASSQTVNIAHFTEGVYFLVLQDNGRVQSQKFIKQ
jgi:hypothetical protein